MINVQKLKTHHPTTIVTTNQQIEANLGKLGTSGQVAQSIMHGTYQLHGRLSEAA